ncbi:hypothetical protein TSUD_73460 [Trifolium subterraneum]|uniref:SURP motif domain-containing protein n=1 Tax=Trifolium subterraneum TaxID=3900 RepID=A0A2Z6MDR5_TRISU|nr:hypothetical protein TSUD_73460 [Trifolium subterraneum]
MLGLLPILPLLAPLDDGIIDPPENLRTIIDKASEFVAKHGPEFERRLIVSNAGNPMLNFLNSLDPHHAYYQHKLAEFRVLKFNLQLNN